MVGFRATQPHVGLALQEALSITGWAIVRPKMCVPYFALTLTETIYIYCNVDESL
jgi:hypothetical protein